LENPLRFDKSYGGEFSGLLFWPTLYIKLYFYQQKATYCSCLFFQRQ